MKNLYCFSLQKFLENSRGIVVCEHDPGESARAHSKDAFAELDKEEVEQGGGVEAIPTTIEASAVAKKAAEATVVKSNERLNAVAHAFPTEQLRPAMSPIPEGIDIKETAKLMPDTITGTMGGTRNPAIARTTAQARARASLAREIYKAVYGQAPPTVETTISPTADIPSTYDAEGAKSTFTYQLNPAIKERLIGDFIRQHKQ